VPLSPVTVEKFGGLRLSSDPEDVGVNGATDMLNVELADDLSYVRTRAGSSALATGFGWQPRAFAPAVFNSSHVMLATGQVGSDYQLTAVGVTGTKTFLGAWPSGGVGAGYTAPQIVTFGIPTASFAFVAWGGTPLQRTDGVGVGPSVGSPGYIAATPQSNRLVQGWFYDAADVPVGANGTTSTVYFSDAGAPETFSPNNYVHLRPNDGEDITGIITWRELLFVFKRSRAFVFYGESTDSTGQPVFNYREISLPANISPQISAYRCVASTASGVYFTTTDGIYRTTGGTPTKVSSVIDYSGFVQPGHLGTVGDRVFHQVIVYGEDERAGHFVFNERNESWTYYELGPAISGAPVVGWPQAFPIRNTFFFGDATSLHMSLYGAAAEDNGVPMPSRYRMGVSDLGSAAQKVVREVLVDGSGVVEVGLGGDWAANPAGDTVTLGTAPAVAQGRGRTAVRARNFRVQISASSGAWSVSRLTLHLRSQRPTGVESR